jgi:hypothetical protein
MSGGNRTKHPFEWSLEIAIFMLLLLTLIATSGAALLRPMWTMQSDPARRALGELLLT